MLKNIRSFVALGLFAICGWPISGLSAEPKSAQEPNQNIENNSRVILSFNSRYATASLAAALIELSKLEEKDRYSAVLSLGAEASDHLVSANPACFDRARKDPTGRLFDIARCAKIWPDAGKADEPKALVSTFAAKVAKKGVSAFPAVSTSTFELMLRLSAGEVYGIRKTNPKLLSPGEPTIATDATGQVTLSKKIADVLCNPGITLVAKDRCEIKVVPRLSPTQPDFFVSQTGYRLELLNRMPRKLAEELAETLRLRVLSETATLRHGPVDDASVLVTVAPTRPGNGSQVSQPQSVDQAKPPRAVNDLDEYLALIHVKSADIDLSKGDGANAPDVLLFDDTSMVGAFEDWYPKIKAAVAQSADCEFGDTPRWHPYAVTGLLFPILLEAFETPNANPPIVVPDLSWSGSILTKNIFIGADPLHENESGSQRWFDAGQYGSGGTPVVAIAAFKDRYKTSDVNARTAVKGILSNESIILVVSAAEKAQESESGNYTLDYSPSKIDDARVIRNCIGNSWPSCLGLHPHVLVVAPTAGDPGQVPTLYNPLGYVLGASTVQIAAPAVNVPMIAPCVTSSPGSGSASAPFPSAWGVHYDIGTSFAAPIVGLIVARIIEVGQPLIKTVPDAAIWRILATADPIPAKLSNGQPSSDLVEFGQVNGERALRGAKATEIGPYGRATIYPRSGPPAEQVVVPYPWNDAGLNVGRERAGLKRSGIARFGRGVLPYTKPEGRVTSIEFSRVLSIVRHSDALGASNSFDLIVLTEVDPGTHTWAVDTRRKVSLGNPTRPGGAGFCRLDDAVVPGEPACLYALDEKSNKFVPMNMMNVDTIVLPPLHISAHNSPGKFVANINPTDLAAVIKDGSPWREAYCTAGPRELTKDLLTGDATCPVKLQR